MSFLERFCLPFNKVKAFSQMVCTPPQYFSSQKPLLVWEVAFLRFKLLIINVLCVGSNMRRRRTT